jgi:hypothetical protein
VNFRSESICSALSGHSAAVALPVAIAQAQLNRAAARVIRMSILLSEVLERLTGPSS